MGAPGTPASFTFNATPTFEAGGPDVFGGSAITVAGDVVSGQEGSGQEGSGVLQMGSRQAKRQQPPHLA
jgi:hypothetical protein